VRVAGSGIVGVFSKSPGWDVNGPALTFYTCNKERTRQMKRQVIYNRPDYPAGMRPMKSVRAFCLDCMGGSPKNVEGCEDSGCALWHLRFGRSAEASARRGKSVDISA